MAINKSIIANNIKREREKQGISQAKLAEKADLSTQYVSQIETAKKMISISSAGRIADALNIPIELIIGNGAMVSSTANSEIDMIFADCSEFERQVMLEVLRATKKAIRTNKDLL